MIKREPASIVEIEVNQVLCQIRPRKRNDPELSTSPETFSEASGTGVSLEEAKRHHKAASCWLPEEVNESPVDNFGKDLVSFTPVCGGFIASASHHKKNR